MTPEEEADRSVRPLPDLGGMPVPRLFRDSMGSALEGAEGRNRHFGCQDHDVVSWLDLMRIEQVGLPKPIDGRRWLCLEPEGNAHPLPRGWQGPRHHQQWLRARAARCVDNPREQGA